MHLSQEGEDVSVLSGKSFRWSLLISTSHGDEFDWHELTALCENERNALPECCWYYSEYQLAGLWICAVFISRRSRY